MNTIHVACNRFEAGIIQVKVKAEICAPAVPLDGVPNQNGRAIGRLPTEQRSIGWAHAGHHHVGRIGFAQNLWVLPGEAGDISEMRHLRIDAEDFPGVAFAQDDVPHQGLTARHILVNGRPLGRNLNAALLHESLERLEFRGIAVPLHKIGDEIIVFQEKAKVRVTLRQCDCLRDDAVAAAEAFFLRACPIEVEVGKGYDVNFMPRGGNLLGT